MLMLMLMLILRLMLILMLHPHGLHQHHHCSCSVAGGYDRPHFLRLHSPSRLLLVYVLVRFEVIPLPHSVRRKITLEGP